MLPENPNSKSVGHELFQKGNDGWGAISPVYYDITAGLPVMCKLGYIGMKSCLNLRPIQINKHITIAAWVEIEYLQLKNETPYN